jgi:hypothetical protein
LDKEEQELLESFENGEWVRVANPEAKIRRQGIPYQTLI